MKIGIGLPTTVPGTPGPVVLEWARSAEAAGFSSLATIDRIAYPNYESMVALAAAAAVTERVELVTNVLLAPTRDAAVLAKEAASVDQLSSGRLTLGIGVGGRPDDYAVVDEDWAGRGRRLDADLQTWHDIWSGQPPSGTDKAVAPTPVHGRVPLLFGGQPKLAVPRAIRWAGGVTIGGLPPAMASGWIDEARSLYAELGGTGELRIVALGYFALGDDTDVDALRDYYSFLGDMAEMIAGNATRSGAQAKEVVQQWTDLGVDEYVFNPAFADVSQVERLAEAVL